jgi:hypothetical protein
MISKSSIALLFLALTSYVNAAAISPRAVGNGQDSENQADAGDRQFFIGLVREGLC